METLQTLHQQAAHDPSSVVTTGTFDGVHRGHQAILEYLVERARQGGGRPTVVTFDPHPRAVVTGHPVPLLTTPRERAEALAEHGVERVFVLPFSRALSLMEPEAYVADVLVESVGMQEIVVGYDHRFGRDRRGDRALLERLGEQHGFTVDVIPEQIVGGTTVSSTQIRSALAGGDVALAADLLGRPYAFSGDVVRGHQRGRTIGFPTANLRLEDERKAVPGVGVYSVWVEAQGERHPAMMNIGRRPTFETDGALSLEAHLLDFRGDLYGETLRVEFHTRLRDERRFGGPEDLVKQLEADRASATAALA